MNKMILVALLFFVTNIQLFAQVGEEIGVDEHLGDMIPLDLEMIDSDGNVRKLGELLNGKPTVLSLVYYKCPGICNALLGGLRDVVERCDLEPGTDYNIISVSFAPGEGYELARDKKRNYMEGMTRKIQPEGWIWTAMDSVSLNELTTIVGFKYKIDIFEEGRIDYLHAATLIFLSPEGKITRYLPGTEFMPFNFKMAALQAAKGEALPTLDRIIALCFKYDPDGRGYVLNVTRVMGTIMLIGLGIFILWLVKSKKKNVGASK